jgi:hypothetical protein
MLKRLLTLYLLLVVSIVTFGQSAALSDHDAELIRRQREAPSEANQTSLKETLKWLSHEGGTADGGRNQLTGLYTYGVKFSACKLSYRVSVSGTPSHARVSPAIAPVYPPPVTTYNVRLSELNPDSVAARSAEDTSYVHFATAGGAKEIRIERSGLQFGKPGPNGEPEKGTSEGRLEIRDRRIADEYANAFRYAIALCRDQK